MASERIPIRVAHNSKDIWILGAGFSKQLYDKMPLMTELSESARHIIKDRFTNPLLLNNLEFVLSELRSDNPWKSQIERYEDLALYGKIIEHIQTRLWVPYNCDKLDDKYNADIGKRLVNTWHMNRNPILTFNYDTLIESLLYSIRCKSYYDNDISNKEQINLQHIYPIPISHIKTRMGMALKEEESHGDCSFRYYKLHGSLNYYAYKDPFQNINLFYSDDYNNDAYSIYNETKARYDLYPFIVPPISDKQVFIEHPMLYSMWGQAAYELANNYYGRIIFIGYSMPQTDIAVLNMLRATIKSNCIDTNGDISPEIIVVNPDLDVAYHVKKQLCLPNPVGQVTDVGAFLDQYAPAKFVREHVYLNQSYEEALEEQKLRQGIVWRKSDKSIKEKYTLLNNKMLDNLRDRVEYGYEWFLDKEEYYNWRNEVVKNAPIDCWL